MKTRMKKIIAILCALSVILTTVLIVPPARQTEAANVTPTVPASLKEITFSDFGVANGEYGSLYKQLTDSKITNFDGTVFQAKITFPAMRKTHFKFGGSVAGEGIEMIISRESEFDAIVVQDATKTGGVKNNAFSPKAYNTVDEDIVAFTGTEVTYKFTTQYVDSDNEGTKNDVRFGIWVNDTLLGGEYLLFEDYAGYMGKWISVERTEAAASTGTKVAVASIAPTPKIIPAEFKMITFSDFGIPNGTYTSEQHKEYTGTSKSFDKTYFHAKMTIPTNSSSYIKIGGKEAGKGIQLQIWRQGSFDVLWVTDSGGTKMFEKYEFYSMYENVEFTNREIDLKLSMQYVDSDGDLQGTDGKDDLKFGIWVDNKLFGGDFLYLVDYVDSDHSMGKWLSVIPAAGSAGVSVTSIVKLAETFPTGLEMVTFSDFGIANGTHVSDFYKQYAGNRSNLNGTYLHAKMTIPSADGTFIKIGGKNAGTGIELKIYQNASGVDIIHIKDSYDGNQTQGFAGITQFLSTVEGMTFTGREIDLKLTIQYVDSDGDNATDDVKFGIWVDDKLISGEYRILENYVNTDHSMGKWLSLITTGTAKAEGVTVTSIAREQVTFPTGLKMITLSDFGIANGNYKGEQHKQYTGNLSDLDGTYLHAKMTIPSADGTFIKIGGKGAGTGIELKIYQNSAGVDIIHIKDSYNAGQTQGFAGTTQFLSTVEGMTFTGREIDLKLTIQYVDSDGDNATDDLKFGIWVDDRLISGEYRILQNYVNTDHSMGKWLSLIAAGTAKTEGFTVTSIAREKVTFPTGLKMITLSDFGIANGNYKGEQHKSYTGNLANLDGTYLHAKMTIPSADGSFIKIGGTKAGTGIELKIYQNSAGVDIIHIKDSYESTQTQGFAGTTQFLSTVEGLTFTGREIDLKLTIQYVDSDNDNEADDVQFGIWVDDQLISGEYRILENYVNTDHSMGKWLSLIATGGAKTEGFTVTSIAREAVPFPTGLNMLTFSDYGIANGTYKVEKHVPCAEITSLDGIYFHAKMTIPSADGTFIKIGGKKAGTGIELKIYQNAAGVDIIHIKDSYEKTQTQGFAGITQFLSTVEGLTFTGREIDLKLTIQYVDSDGDNEADDVKFGIWVDDQLIGGDYRILENYVNTDHSMGKWLSLITTDTAKKVGVTIKSIERPAEVLPEGLVELSFDDFGVAEDFYAGTKAGEYKGKTLDGTVLKGKITFSENGQGFLLYGGKKSWGGFALTTVKEGKETILRLYDSKAEGETGKFSDYKFYKEIAGVPLVGEQLDLMISTQFVDHDGDGKKDDVKVGMWFGGKLYNNKYIYLIDYVNTKHSMGNWMTLVMFDNAQIAIGSPKPLDLAMFGLDANWQKTLLGTKFNSQQILSGHNPNTGDGAESLTWILVSALALGTIVTCGYMGRTRRKEQE